jgi:hypothetical protein
MSSLKGIATESGTLRLAPADFASCVGTKAHDDWFEPMNLLMQLDVYSFFSNRIESKAPAPCTILEGALFAPHTCPGQRRTPAAGLLTHARICVQDGGSVQPRECRPVSSREGTWLVHIKRGR